MITVTPFLAAAADAKLEDWGCLLYTSSRRGSGPGPRLTILW